MDSLTVNSQGAHRILMENCNNVAAFFLNIFQHDFITSLHTEEIPCLDNLREACSNLQIDVFNAFKRGTLGVCEMLNPMCTVRDQSLGQRHEIVIICSRYKE